MTTRILFAFGLVLPILAQAGAQNVRLVNPLGTDTGNTCIDTACRTIGRAIEVAVDGDLVDIAAGEYTETLSIGKSLTLQGAGQDNITIIQAHEQPGHALGRAITISGEDLEIEISGMTIRHGRMLGSDGHGGGLFVDGSALTLTDVTLRDNFSERSGGGLYSRNSSPVMSNVIFRDNNALNGGGMFFAIGSPELVDVMFVDNTADNSGGGMINGVRGFATLSDVEFIGNAAGEGGGGLSVSIKGSATLTGVDFIGNWSDRRGGGISNSGTVALTDVTLENNEAQQGGGMHGGSFSSSSLTSVIFTNNHAISNPGEASAAGGGDANPQGDFTLLRGGGMYNNIGSTASLNNVVFTGNKASYAGGGMYNFESAPLLTGVTFDGNLADSRGGGMFNTEDSTPELFDVVFDDNSAGARGGGMSNEDSAPELTDVQFRGNSAQFGGGMYNLDSAPVLANVSFNGNLAPAATACGPTPCRGAGGGMSNFESVPHLTNVTFSGNRAQGSGGGMFNSNDGDPTQIPVIRNSLFWNNQDETGTGTANASITNDDQASFIAAFSLVEGRLPPGEGNLDGTDSGNDPLFIDMPDPDDAPAMVGNLRLRPQSPAIDIGNNAFVSNIDADLDGNPRILGGTVDLGPYEFGGNAGNVIFRDRFER